MKLIINFEIFTNPQFQNHKKIKVNIKVKINNDVSNNMIKLSYDLKAVPLVLALDLVGLWQCF